MNPSKLIRRLSACLLATLAVSVIAACIGDHDEKPAPSVKIISPANGSTIAGPNVFVQVSAKNFGFAGAPKKVSAAQHDEDNPTGHVHVFLDKPAGLDANAIYQMTKSDSVTLTNISAGPHYIIVQGATATHADFEGMKDSVAFTVK